MNKRVWAWGVMGSNGLIHMTTMKEAIANDWREQGLDVRGLVEEDACPTQSDQERQVRQAAREINGFLSREGVCFFTEEGHAISETKVSNLLERVARKVMQVVYTEKGKET